MMLNYVTSTISTPDSKLPIPASWLTCKIALSNNASRALFKSLGFVERKISEVWQEVEMRFVGTGSEDTLFPGCIEEVLIIDRR